MNLKQELRGNFPSSFDKTATMFCALVANDKGTAVMEATLNEMIEYMAEWVNNPSVYDQEDEMLETTVDFFSYFERFTNESDKALKNRFKALFVRNNDTTWGTAYDIRNVFADYFSSGNVYVCENTNDISDNLILCQDFNDDEISYWTIEAGETNSESRFVGKKGLNLTTVNSGAYQTVTIENTEDTAYALHWFQKGTVLVKFTDTTNSLYWDNTNREWTSTETSNSFTSTDWEKESMICLFPSSCTEIKVEFLRANSTDIAYVDYVRLFQKQLHPSFTVVVQYTGYSNGNALALAPGSADSEDTTLTHTTNDDGINEYSTPLGNDYDNYSYFDNTFITGVSSGLAANIYQQILDTIKPAGVKAYLEIIQKDV